MRLNPALRKWLPWALLAVAVLATAAAYWPGRTGGWVFDDYPNIVDNQAIHITPGHASLTAWVNAALSSPASFLHRPLASITFALNWLQGGGDPLPFKLTNIAIHLVNGVLLFCMLRTLLRLTALRAVAPRMARDPQSDATAHAVGAGFAGNPQRRDDDRAQGALLHTSGTSVGAGLAGDSDDIPPAPRADPLPAEGGVASPRASRDPLPPEGGEEPAASKRRKVAKDGFTAIDDRAATRLALIVSAAWMLLPINLMAVLYVVQRMASLAQVFVLAGLWAYLYGRWMMLTAVDARRDRHGFALAVAGIVLGTVLGVTSKETAVLLPLYAFLVELIIIGFGRRGRHPPQSPFLRKGEDVRPLPQEGGRRASTGGMPPQEGRSEADARASAGVQRGEDIHPLPQEGGRRASTGGMPPQEGRSEADARASAGAQRGEDIHPLPQEGGRRASAGGMPGGDQRIWGLFTITLFVPGVLGFLWALRGALSTGAFASRDFTLAQRLLTEPRVLVDYLHWTLLPNPMVLSLYHDEIVKSTGWLTPWTTLGAIALLAALILVAVVLRKRRPLVALGIAWFFAGQLLTATIIPLELVYEQRMYFASIGVLLAAGVLLVGVRWKIVLPFLRGFLVAIALLWFALATNLRAQEWSNPLRLAISEANRHPASARAVYEAGRLLLIASNYHPGKVLDESWKYLRQAAAIPGASSLPDQAMIMIADHDHPGDDAAFWDSMTTKLARQPTSQEDISALISLTSCYAAGICRFDLARLQHAYQAALSRPHPKARLNGAYAAFSRDQLHDDAQAETYLARAVAGDPSEPAYRVDLAALYARNGQTTQALEQIDALRRINLAGRLDRQIEILERLAEQGKVDTPASAR